MGCNYRKLTAGLATICVLLSMLGLGLGLWLYNHRTPEGGIDLSESVNQREARLFEELMVARDRAIELNRGLDFEAAAAANFEAQAMALDLIAYLEAVSFGSPNVRRLLVGTLRAAADLHAKAGLQAQRRLQHNRRPYGEQMIEREH